MSEIWCFLFSSKLTNYQEYSCLFTNFFFILNWIKYSVQDYCVCTICHPIPIPNLSSAPSPSENHEQFSYNYCFTAHRYIQKNLLNATSVDLVCICLSMISYKWDQYWLELILFFFSVATCDGLNQCAPYHLICLNVQPTENGTIRKYVLGGVGVALLDKVYVTVVAGSEVPSAQSTASVAGSLNLLLLN